MKNIASVGSSATAYSMSCRDIGNARDRKRARTNTVHAYAERRQEATHLLHLIISGRIFDDRGSREFRRGKKSVLSRRIARLVEDRGGARKTGMVNMVAVGQRVDRDAESFKCQRC